MYVSDVSATETDVIESIEQETLSSIEQRVDEQRAKIHSDCPPKPFPNLAAEVLTFGLEKEAITNRQIDEFVAEVEKIQIEIDTLLNESKALSEQMKGKDGEELDAIKVKKDDLTTQIDNLRSRSQIIFTTRVQPLIQSIGAIMESLKEIIRQDAKLKEKTNQLPR